MKKIEKKVQTLNYVEGKVISYHVDKILCPNGNEAKREFVTHPGGVCILAVNDKKQIIMERQFRYPFLKEIYELPAGKLEMNEDPLLAAYREFEEETGYKAESMHSLGEIYPSVGYTNEIIHLFYTEHIIKTKTNLDEDEFLDIEWVDLKTIVEMIHKNEIKDAKTIALILKYITKE